MNENQEKRVKEIFEFFDSLDKKYMTPYNICKVHLCAIELYKIGARFDDFEEPLY